MVKITEGYIIRHSNELKCFPQHFKKESDKEFLRRITHLKIQNRCVEFVEPLPNCENVRNLYLQINVLHNIPQLDHLKKLTHLYLQRNKISKISNLENIVCLKKLYLGYNEISVLEGMEKIKTLRELHIEYQNLPIGESIYFEPRSIKSLAATLEVFDISGCGLLTLSALTGMKCLKELHLIENNLRDLNEVSEVLSTFPKLRCVYLTGNSISQLKDYSDKIICNARSLQCLDGNEVNERTRAFIDGWRKARKLKEANSTMDAVEKRRALPKAVHFNLRNSLPTLQSGISNRYSYPSLRHLRPRKQKKS